MIFLCFLAHLCVSKIKFGIMIDAGSTGTRAFIYSWDSAKVIPDVHPHPNVEDAFSISLDIPLASAAQDITVVDKIFTQIIDYCKDKIPQKYVLKTRLFVFATAGMRLLQSYEQERILNRVYTFLSENSPFKLKRRYIRIISGIEEGVYGWLSVNHLLNRFDYGKSTVGALDMGGASFQIAIQVPPDATSNSLHNVTVGKLHLTLFAHSYLGYGVNQALWKITSSIAAVLDTDYIQNPCVQNGYRTEMEGISVEGTGNFTACSKLIEAMLLKSPEYATIQIPNLEDVRRFIAMASFYYVNKALNLPENSSFKELKQKSEEFCSKQYYQLSEANPNDKYLHTYCFSSIYQYNMLTRGFRFTDEDVIIEKRGEIDGVGLSWTIGAMLSEIAQIEIDDKEPPSMIWLVFSFATMCFLCWFIFILIKSMRRAPFRIRGKHII